MKKVLVLGAGLSTPYLIRYLLEKHAGETIVIDRDYRLAKSRIGGHLRGRAVEVSITRPSVLEPYIREADVVVSMLPAFMHADVIKLAIKHKKPVVTASYIKGEIKELAEEARKAGVPVIGECGADPGIDHAMVKRKIDQLKTKGYKIRRVRTAAGALVHPDYLKNNPWKYKFTWAPRNVIMAGRSTTAYILNSKLHLLPYPKPFDDVRQMHNSITGTMEAYPNSDSTRYLNWYGFSQIDELWRGSIRYPGFISSWRLIAMSGITDPFLFVPSVVKTYKQLMSALLGTEEVEEKLREMGATEDDIYRIKWLGLLNEEPLIAYKKAPSVPDVFENLLRQKWKLNPNDRDMVIIQEEIEYETTEGKKMLWKGSMYHVGEDAQNTAIAFTVGIPVAIITRLLVEGKLKLEGGLYIPVIPEIYIPLLDELQELGMVFKEEEQLIEETVNVP